MKDCGVSVDKEAISVFFKQLEGNDIVSLTKAGATKTVSMPACGGGGVARAAAPTGGAAAAEAPKEEKKEEPEDVDMGGLFGGDDDY